MCIRRSVSLSVTCSYHSINISLLSSCDWEGVGSSLGVLAALVLPGIVPCFFSGKLSTQYFVEIWQQFLWTALTAIFCWDLAAIFLISSSSNILVRFGSDSLWAAVISLDGFDSNILVWFGSNSLWAALVAIFLVRFGSNFSGRLWQKYFGEIRQQFSLGSSRSNFLLRLDSNFYFWLALAAIFWWASAAILSGQLFQQYFWWDSAAISLDIFDSNILVRFGTNFLWAAVATISGVTIIYLM